jgi:hypothetical protein
LYCRIIIGAPRGTYPGGLTGLPMLVDSQRFAGLVYLCSIDAPGDCNGLISDEQNVSNNDRRLFDGDRKFCIVWNTACSQGTLIPLVLYVIVL